MYLITGGDDLNGQSLLLCWEVFTEKWQNRANEYQNLDKLQADKELIAKLDTKIVLGSVGGQFYAMDQDGNWDRTAYGIYSMFNYKIVDSDDSGDNAEFLEFFENNYGTNLKNILEKNRQEIEKNNILSSDFVPNNIYFNTELDVFYDSDDANERLSGKTKLQVDLKYVLEMVARNLLKIGNTSENIFPISLYYFDSLNGTGNAIKPPYGIIKNYTIWLLNSSSGNMKQFTKLLCDLNNHCELNLVVMSIVGSEIDLEKFVKSEFENQIADFGNSDYYPIFHTKTINN